jgi:hypothetical protein
LRTGFCVLFLLFFIGLFQFFDHDFMVRRLALIGSKLMGDNSIFLFICCWMGYTNITNKSQMWHSNMDGLELVFFYFFFILSVFYQFIYYIFVFLFVVFKLDKFIKLSWVNDSNLEFSIFFFFYECLCYLDILSPRWKKKKNSPRHTVSPLFSGGLNLTTCKYKKNKNLNLKLYVCDRFHYMSILKFMTGLLAYGTFWVETIF